MYYVTKQDTEDIGNMGYIFKYSAQDKTSLKGTQMAAVNIAK